MCRELHYVVVVSNGASAVFAILAAIRWYQSATFEGEQRKRHGPEVMIEGRKGKIGLVATIEGQSRISRKAASMAAWSAGLLALALIVQAIGGT